MYWHTLYGSMESTTGGVNASSPCDSDVLSPSQSGYTKKEFITMPPEEKLKHFESRAQARGDNQEVGTICTWYYTFHCDKFILL